MVSRRPWLSPLAAEVSTSPTAASSTSPAPTTPAH